MEDLLASIRRAIHEDIAAVPSATAAKGTMFKGAMRESRVRIDEEASAAALEIQDLREKINRTRASESMGGEAGPWRLGGPSAPQTLRPSFAEADLQSPDTGIWDGEPALAGPGMLSAEAEIAAGNAFNKLAHKLLNRPGADRSIEDMTRELLRGMLKQWLDANLPGLVERLVREEIERVARRNR